MHIPVLQKEVIQYLDPKPNENFIDCTLGQGGHSLAIIKRNGTEGKVLGIEADPELFKITKLQISESGFKDRLILVNDFYTNLKKIVEKYNFGLADGILFDVGMSSWHLEGSGRGFTFQKNEPLDMRYNKAVQKIKAEDILNQWASSEIENILREYGDEKFSERIAKKVCEARKIKPIKSTFQLLEIIKRAIPSRCCHQRAPRRRDLRGKHFATRTFQALRIAVNDELNNLKKSLFEAKDILKPKGRLVVISFHSLEDRIVKNFFRDQAKPRSKEEDLPRGKEGTFNIITKKPIRPSSQEIEINPRSRSAKLRAAVRIL